MLKRTSIPVLQAAPNGQQFVMYGDSCSGVPGALHEGTFRQVNAVIRALEHAPQFICFTGDEIMGLTSDAEVLRRQWDHFFQREMNWLDRNVIPLYHTTGNHTVYDSASEDIFREVMAHLPQNGPVDQRSLSYFVRRGDLLMIFVNTLWSHTGGEGTVETEWLESTLTHHADAEHKLVFGHHPVWVVNGYAGDYQRNIEFHTGRRFWDILVQQGVLAYVCSHILAYDVQVHDGVLQICSAGAGTAHRMPESVEYLHVIQASLDEWGLCYQVLDRAGAVREWLSWEVPLPPSARWTNFDSQSARALPSDCLQNVDRATMVVWEMVGQLNPVENRQPITLLCAHAEGRALPALWLGVSGVRNQLTLLLRPQADRSPYRWQGPMLPTQQPFRVQFGIHSGMGPGGFLWRWQDDDPWSSMIGASAWGAERLRWSHEWTSGDDEGTWATPLSLRWHHQSHDLSDHLP
ncbi:MAG: metallophosphoesterase [Anaerolineaceae bacterium]|nr:metallophosphoesterase [Anaerolineaceae bacterium]